MSLKNIKHIVILMLENRSFDHMLGYLELEGGRADIDGLTSDKFNTDTQGNHFPVMRLHDTSFPHDPCHSGNCVAVQLQNRNNGFAISFADTEIRPPLHTKIGQEAPQDVRLIMGYYGATEVRSYDHLASEFMVCDRW